MSKGMTENRMPVRAVPTIVQTAKPRVIAD